MGSDLPQPETFPKEVRDALFVVVSDDGRGGGFDRVGGVCRCVALVGHLEHAEIVVVIAETDDSLDTQQFLHFLDCSAFACIAVVNV